MANSSDSRTSRPPAFLGWLMLLLGLYLLLAAVGVLPMDPQDVHAPYWVIGLCGFIVVLGGLMILLGHRARLNDAFAALFCYSGAAVGVWVALFSDPQQIAGGVPFLSREANAALGRVVFGFGAVISLAIAIYATRRAFGADHAVRAER